MTNQGFSVRAMPANEPANEDDDELVDPALAALIDKDAARLLIQKRARVLARLEDVTDEWMDEMTTRVSNEIKRQIEMMEKSTPKTPSDFAANARTLATLQKMLAETLRMKRDRTMRGETKDKKHHADPKGKIVGRLDRQAAEGDARRASGGSD